MQSLLSMDEALAEARQLIAEGKQSDAAARCRTVLRRDPATAEALLLLGAIATLGDRAQDAVSLLRMAVALAPDNAKACNALGIALRETRQWDEAQRYLEQALRLTPDVPDIMVNLARTLYGAKKWALAEIIYRRLLNRDQLSEKDHKNLAWTLIHLKRQHDAVNFLTTSIIRHGPDAGKYYAMAVAHHELRETRQAIDAYRAAITADPRLMMPYVNLSSLYLRHGNAQATAEILRQMLEIRSNDPAAHMNLGLAMAALGKTEEAISCFEKTVAAEPQNDRCRSNIVFYSQYLDNRSPLNLYELAREWNWAHGKRWRNSFPVHRQDATPERRLRIGYVSSDFKNHSCNIFLRALFGHHDRANYEIHCYSGVEFPDAATHWIQERTDCWHPVHGLEDAAVASLIHHDQIDILVDLAGHTSGHRLGVFARKPAPVQVTWLGYPGTTGLDTIDWRLSDPWLTPPGGTELYSEKIYNLDRISHAFSTVCEGIEPGPMPAESNGYVTFGSFNNFAKVSDTTARLWAGVLKAIPDARLLIKCRYVESGEARDNVLDRLRRHGADLDRVILRGGEERMGEHLKIYHQVDIALDTFPYNGMTTTCEAVWMGVPVLALTGDTTASRYSTSVLSAVGLNQYIADSAEDFIARAVRLAADRDGLRSLKAGLRRQVLDSPLCDHAGFTAAVEAAYREMWRRWCREKAA
ncbi:MAG: tetratricopeptide repeat protein [Rhodospirillales bacterium]|nr:tetratricopeptide repeat protein [Rhodospirillales bacterium]